MPSPKRKGLPGRSRRHSASRVSRSASTSTSVSPPVRNTAATGTGSCRRPRTHAERQAPRARHHARSAACMASGGVADPGFDECLRALHPQSGVCPGHPAGAEDLGWRRRSARRSRSRRVRWPRTRPWLSRRSSRSPLRGAGWRSTTLAPVRSPCPLYASCRCRCSRSTAASWPPDPGRGCRDHRPIGDIAGQEPGAERDRGRGRGPAHPG